MFAKIKNFLFDILFPIPDLTGKVRLNDTLFCPLCRARLPEQKRICHPKSQFLLGAATGYDNETVRKLVWQLKYWGRAGNGVILGNLLTAYVKDLASDFSSYAVIPVPLSQKRMRARGFNQAELIAGALAKNLKFRMISNALIRQKDAPPQAESPDWESRRKNIAGCFGVLNPDAIKNSNIILVDDVFTSGATMSEAAHELKDFGAKKIIGLTVARAG